PYSLPTLFISRDRFARTLEFLRSRYRILPLAGILEALRRGEALPANALAITFDDGYRDVFDNAIPVLHEASLPATVFLPTAYIDSPGAVFWWDEAYYLLRTANRTEVPLRDIAEVHGDRLPAALLDAVVTAGPRELEPAIVATIDALQSCPPPAAREFLDAAWERTGAERAPFVERNAIGTWEDVQRASANGIAFGSHTRHHVFLHREPEDLVRDELRVSRRDIEERLGEEVLDFAYPGGRITGDVRRWVREAGYRCGLTTEPGINGDGDEPFALRRIDMWNGSVSGYGETFSGAHLAVKLLGL
ncbi:MAG: polysaccharide deacetylase family protein, partial [Acidobacteriota bacterium]|nr:polysaccharide deacetylase family protein [Acidobacteriota bacterium]